MVVLSNHRLGPRVELLVSDGVATSMFRDVAAAARACAESHWEHELVRWLEQQADRPQASGLDVGDIGWTRDHFESQRQFLLDAIWRAAVGGAHRVLLQRWRELIEAHPAASVQVGRRWNWLPTA